MEKISEITLEEIVEHVDITVEDPDQDRTIKNIRKALIHSLDKKYGIKDKSKADELLKIHGLHKDNFNFVGNIQNSFRERLNDLSIDENANKNEKTMRGIVMETLAPVQKAIGYDMLYQTMREMYGKKIAKHLSAEMYDYTLSISDSTKILIPYCWSFDASKLVMFGRPFGQLQSSPPKRLDSYIASLTETIHQMSNHLAGAIAIGTFFFDVCHIMYYKEKIELTQLKKDKHLRKLIENEFQTFVHSVNHLSRQGVESPFTNISIFDTPKLRAFIEEMDWYFEGACKETDAEGNKVWDEEHIAYIIDYIKELQIIYIDFFSRGDPGKNGMPYRFPVSTINVSISEKKDKDDNTIYEVVDKRHLDVVCKRDIYRYNIFASEGKKIASCCRLISDSEMMGLASQSNSFGAGSSASLGSHRVITIDLNRIALESTSLDDYYNVLTSKINDAAMILKAHKHLIEITKEHGLQMFISMGWINMKRMFSTFGIIGLVEAVETLKTRFSDTNSFTKSKVEELKISIVKHFNAIVLEKSKHFEITGNIEQIPAESMAARLPRALRIIFGDDKCKSELYANQFVPLWKQATLWERLEEDGKFNRLITGGGIVHAQIGEKVTAKQAKNIIKYAIKVGCEHFALNSVYTECNSGHTTFGDHNKCPECGDEIKTKYTRVVGFFTPVKDWNKQRRDWEFPKRKFVDIKQIEEDNE